MLERVREVARRINERVRQVTGDTQDNVPALPTDQTDPEHQPLPPPPSARPAG
ncbi:MAG: hypothetical protein U0871_25620 [Gemmataceae bacterium]